MSEGFVESKKVVKTQDGVDRGEEISTLGPCESDHFTWSFQFEFMLTLQLMVTQNHFEISISPDFSIFTS